MPSRDNASTHHAPPWRLDAFAQLCDSAAAAVDAILTRWRQRWSTIQVGAVSEAWLRQHSEHTHKHNE